MLFHLVVIAAIGGTLYFLTNRAPVIAPTPKAILKWVILAVTCIALLDTALDLHVLAHLRP